MIEILLYHVYQGYGLALLGFGILILRLDTISGNGIATTNIFAHKWSKVTLINTFTKV